MTTLHSFTLGLILLCFNGPKDASGQNYIPESTINEVQRNLLEQYGEQEADRIMRGTAMVASLWRESDGSPDEFFEFCTENFLDTGARSENAPIVMENLDVLRGYSSIIRSRLSEYASFTDRQQTPPDPFFRNSYNPPDVWGSKLAFFIQLNYPYRSPLEKMEEGAEWDRFEWALARIGDAYSSRPAEGFEPPYSSEAGAWRRITGNYFLRMGDLVPGGQPSPFPEGTLLNCHHGLRDNIKDNYTLDKGLDRQELSGLVIERILNGEVPLEFLNDTSTYWDPVNQVLYNADMEETEFEMEGIRRYEGFYHTVRNRQASDKVHEDGSTVVSRTFASAKLDPKRVEEMITDFLSSEEFYNAGQLVRERLGRDLQPFDIWYVGFQSQSLYPAEKLDSIVRARYPDPASLENDLPEIYRRLGFSPGEADWLGNNTRVRPVVSGGYSSRPPLSGYEAQFTTAFTDNGLDYKGFRIAMHELGHTTEMLYTSREVEYPALRGVPTGGITEGVAEYFAYRNIPALGLDEGSEELQRHMQALANFWYLVDMGGQTLTEIRLWQWMYDNPDATPEMVRDAVFEISTSVWNEYFYPVFGIRDQKILSIYNHMITGSYYLFNYFIGNVVMFQLYEAFMEMPAEEGLALACAEGNTLPDLWMERATGSPLSISPMLEAVAEAIEYFSETNW